MKLGRIFLGLLALAVLAVLVYQIPYVNSRLGWRLDGAWAYVRGVIDPVQPLPTADEDGKPGWPSVRAEACSLIGR